MREGNLMAQQQGWLQRGWRLSKISWGLLRQQPGALALPLVAGAAEAIVAAGYVLAVFGISGTDSLNEANPWHFVVLYPLLVILTLVGSFANAMIVSIADARLRSEPISVREAFSANVGRLPLLIGWSLLSATVGLFLRLLEERLPIAGRIAVAIVGVAWSLATMLAIPVLVIENVGPIDAVKRSGTLIRHRFGESVVGRGLVGLPVILIGLPFMIIGGLIATQSLVVGIVIIAIALGAVVAFTGALTGVFTTALYRFATDGETHGAFTADEMAMALRPKKQSGMSGI